MESDEGDDLVGQVLCGTYKVERQIGEGGMGAVYAASHVRLPRKFAIKMLHADALASEEVFYRFRREAEIASSIGHDNIAQVFDFNHTPTGVPFMVLELLDGEDLEQRLERVGSLSLSETASLLKQVASGLEAAHEVGVVHRDLKPPNLFLCPRAGEPERVKILDFGISKSINSTSMVTRTGSVMGSPNFMSPEQADGDVGEIDARTDVFALGCILFHCLTGEFAFEGPTVMGTLYKIVHGKPADLQSLAPDLPEGVRDAIMHALHKDQSARTQSVSELRDEFLAACPDALLLAGVGVSEAGSKPVLGSAPGDKPASGPGVDTFVSGIMKSRKRRGLVGLLFAGTVALAGAAFLLQGTSSAESAVEPAVEPREIKGGLESKTAAQPKALPSAHVLVSDAGAAVRQRNPEAGAAPRLTVETPVVVKVPPQKERRNRRPKRGVKKNSEAEPRSPEPSDDEATQDDWDPFSGR